MGFTGSGGSTGSNDEAQSRHPLTPQQVLEANQEKIELFLRYLNNRGAALALATGVNFHHPTLDELRAIDWALSDLFRLRDEAVAAADGTSVDMPSAIDMVVESAASFAQLVRWADRSDRRIFYQGLMPSDEVVSAALTLFHAAKQQTTP